MIGHRGRIRRAGGVTARLLAVALLPHTAAWAGDLGPPTQELRERLALPDFYEKSLFAGELPVLGSRRVSDFALQEAAYLVDCILEGRDDLRRAMAEARMRVVVMAATEFTTDVPEHADLRPAQYWNRRARGLGASAECPVVSCGEENLLDLAGDPYRAENIFIHEFAHTIHEIGLRAVDPGFDARLRAAYDAALSAGRWSGTYAATSSSEYWAEGVQSWFECNRANDRDHNDIDTREKIRHYDPPLAALIESVFGNRPWRYQKPGARQPPSEHLTGFDRSTAPRFAWPPELVDLDTREKPHGGGAGED